MSKTRPDSSSAPPLRILTGAGLELHVTSRDAALLATCREVLHDLEAEAAVGPGAGDGLVEAGLWDFEPGAGGAGPGPGRKLFYVVQAAHLNELRAAVPEAEGSILLKPVSRVVLKAFLGSVAGGGSGAGTLRASRDEMLQHLLEANLRLQQYDQQRTNFIARAVHDFGAPLTALTGFCGLLSSGELGPLSSVQQQVLERMQRSAARISSMASAMFELSAGPRLGRKPDLREGNIVDALRQAVHETEPQARDKHIELRMERVMDPPVALHFEAAQIEQVMVNLLENACRFAPKYGVVEIAAYPCFWDRREGATRVAPMGRERRGSADGAPNAYRVDVSDNGPGIPGEKLGEIFEEYTSYSGPRDRSGGGLGLAICRLIISRHGGHIWAEARSEGSLFAFVLPLRGVGQGAEG